MRWCVLGLAVVAAASVGERKKVVARCERAALKEEVVDAIRSENRSILIIIQTLTASKSNVCLGVRADWREGLGQCLARMTELRIIAQNNDGSCADCSTLRAVDCPVDKKKAPPSHVIIIGGGEDTGKEDKSLRLRCSGTYCRQTGNPVVLGLGHFPPHDYVGACDVYAYDRRNQFILKGRLDTTLNPPTKVAWIPLLNPMSELRAVWEQSTIFATDVDRYDEYRQLPILSQKRKPRYYPKHCCGDPEDSDFKYLKNNLEPAFENRGRSVAIDFLRDDAFAKPILLPDAERQLFKKTIDDMKKPRDLTLIYAGPYRSTKGQLAFLQKLNPKSLPDSFTIEMYGARPSNDTSGLNGVTDDWDNIIKEISSKRWRQRIVAFDNRISHVKMMRRMSTASGLIHYASADRNPRVLYEALYFGLPLFVTVQSMPYVGLQCHSFVTLTDADAPASIMNTQFQQFTNMIQQSERAKKTTNNDENSRALLSSEDNNDSNLQAAVLKYASSHLQARQVFLTFCQRLGLCATDDRTDVTTPWAKRRGHSCARRSLWRYENWRALKWNASKPLKHALNISSRKCKHNLFKTNLNCILECQQMNAIDRQRERLKPWWQPRFIDLLATNNPYKPYCGPHC